MSNLWALPLSIVTVPVEILAPGLSEDSRDTRDDPVYKKKLEELIERNKLFEEARERSNKGK
jgi:hypothetical protein